MRLRLLILLVLAPAPGCLWTPKPYSSDPLVRTRRAVLADPSRPAILPQHVEPLPPTVGE